jgi:hypothetical protein
VSKTADAPVDEKIIIVGKGRKRSIRKVQNPAGSVDLPATLQPDFKIDKSPTTRAFAKAVKLTHKRLYGEK